MFTPHIDYVIFPIMIKLIDKREAHHDSTHYADRRCPELNTK
jgi:hypothetical protein